MFNSYFVVKPVIIYLDIDGVLVSYLHLLDRDPIDGKHKFIAEAVLALNKIIDLFDAHICIVSTWGRKYYTNDIDSSEFKDFLIGRGITVNGLTFGDCDDRAGFVLKQKELGYTRFIIIDDEALEYQLRHIEIGYNRIIGTNPYRCLDMMDYEWIAFNKSRIFDVNYPNTVKNA